MIPQGQSERNKICTFLNEKLKEDEVISKRLPVNEENFLEAIHDGILLSHLINSLSKDDPKPINLKSLKYTNASLFHKIANAKLVIDGLKKIGISTVNLDPQTIVEKKQNIIYGFMNQIIVTDKSYKPPVQNQTKKEQKPSQIPKQEKPVEKKQEIKEEQSETQQVPANEESQEKEKSTEDFFNKYANLTINQNQYMHPEAAKAQQYENVIGPQVVVLCGSLRKASVHHGMIEYLKIVKDKEFFQSIHFHEPSLSHLPLFNTDLEKQGKIPASVHSLRSIVAKSLGVLVVVPENNGSLAAPIKNAFDWLSQKYEGQQPLEDKKVGIMSSSFLTENQIQDVEQICKLNHANVYQKSMYVSLKTNPFNNATGELTSAEQCNKLAYWYQGFSNFILSGLPNPPEVSFIL